MPDGPLKIAALGDVTPGSLFAVLVRGALRRLGRLFGLAALGHASVVNVDLPVAPHVIEKSAGRLRAVKNGPGPGAAYRHAALARLAAPGRVLRPFLTGVLYRDRLP